MHCNICGSPSPEAIYKSKQNVSITSLCQVVSIKTIVYYCSFCGHLYTKGIENIEEYYDKNYKVLSNSAEEDQLYGIVDNEKIFRTEHQINTILNKVKIKKHARVLDYGSAKGATLKGLLQRRPDIQVHLFDVTEEYIPFWNEFAIPDQWSTYAPKAGWKGSFDLITSFFVLEHVEDPNQFVRNITSLLNDNGQFYCIIPNVYRNIADFVVVDHVNHFSTKSLIYLFQSSGLEIVEIDETSHQDAFTIICKKKDIEYNPVNQPFLVGCGPESVISMAKYWSHFAEKVVEFESLYGEHQTAIYGAGFYGSFIYTCLKNPDNIACIVDQNPYLQGRQLFGIPIIAPEQLAMSIGTIYVGLNPLKAESIVNSIDVWASRELNALFV